MQEKKTNFEIQVKINFAAGIQLFFPPCTEIGRSSSRTTDVFPSRRWPAEVQSLVNFVVNRDTSVA